MKIEIYQTTDELEGCTSMTCFEAEDYIKENIRHQKRIKGIVIIDDIAVKFSFNPNGMDGDIFSTNDAHRSLIRHLIPSYVYYYYQILT